MLLIIMNRRTARRLAGSLLGIYVVLATTGLVLQVLTRTSFADLSVPIPLLFIFFFVLGLWPLTGALIVWHYPRQPVGWLWCIGIPTAAMDQFSAGYASLGTYVFPGSLPGMDLALVWLNWSGMPFGIVYFTSLLLLFPNGRLLSSRWRKVAWTAVGALVLYLPIKALEPGPLVIYPSLNNPIAVSEPVWKVLAPVQWTAITSLWLCFTAAIVSMIFRLHQAHEEERQQVKWLIFPAILFWLGIPFNVLGEYEPSGALFGLAGITHMVAVTGMVIATAIAIFRYRLYDIDIIINKTLVYGALTGALVLVYFSSVVVLQQVIPAESPISIVLSTLAIAALFSPLRRRIQNAIDRRFYRQKYDTEQILAAFSVRMRDEVELERLSEALLSAVEETMQPEHVSMWLKQTDGISSQPD
jgi:hypothetical protein